MFLPLVPADLTENRPEALEVKSVGPSAPLSYFLIVHFDLQKKPDWSKKGEEKKVQEAEAWTCNDKN